MPNDIKRIEIGAATISISSYVTAGGAGTFTDVGYTEGPCTLEHAGSDYKLKPEQVLGAIASIPTEFGVKIKFAMKESAAANLQWALRQGAPTGVVPNTTFLVGDPTETYQQVKIVTKGGKLTATGAAAAQTITVWRGSVEVSDPIAISKEKEKIVGVTIDCLYDESVATADKYYKQVNAGGT